MGHWRVAIDYAPNQGLNKELRIIHVEDGLAVLWDPDAVLPTREDALWCIVPVDMSTAKFKRKYPDVDPVDFKSFDKKFHGYWFDSDRVRVGEYWFKKPATRTYAVMKNGTVDDVTDWDDDENRERDQGRQHQADREARRVQGVSLGYHDRPRS
jgi:hypothetical protein